MALDNENPPSPPKAAPQDNENPPTPPRAVPQDIETPPSPLEAVLQDNEKPPSPSKAAPQDSPKPTLIALDLVELYVIYVNHFLNTLFFGTVCLLLRPDTEFSLFWPFSVYLAVYGCLMPTANILAVWIDSRRMYVLGCLLSVCFTIAASLHRNEYQQLVFCILHAVAMSIFVPSSTAITWTMHVFHSNTVFKPLHVLSAIRLIGFMAGVSTYWFIVCSIGWKPVYYMITASNIVCFGFSCISLFGPEVSLLQPQRQAIWLSLIGISYGLFAYVLTDTWVRPPSISTARSLTMLGGAIVLILIYSFSTPDTQAQRLADIVRGDIAFALMAIAVAIFCVTLAMNPELAALISLVFQRSKLLTITAFGITGLIALMLTVVVLALTSALLQARYGVLLSVLLVGAALFNFALLAVEPSKLIGYPIIIVTALALSWVGITLKVASWPLEASIIYLFPGFRANSRNGTNQIGRVSEH